MADLLSLKLRWGTPTQGARLDAVTAVGPDRAVAVGPRRVLDIHPRRFVEHRVRIVDLVAVATADTWVAASSESGRIWELASFAERARFPATDSIVGLAPLDGGEALATAGLHWVRIVSASTGARIAKVSMPTDHQARGVLPSPDERQLYVHATLSGYRVTVPDGPHRARMMREELAILARRGVGPAEHIRADERGTVIEVPARDALHRVARDASSNALRLEASQLLAPGTIPCVSADGQLATVSAREARVRDASSLEARDAIPVPAPVTELAHVRWLGANARGHVYTLHSDRHPTERHASPGVSRIVRWHLATRSAAVSPPHPRCIDGAVHAPTGVIVTLQADHTVRAYEDRSAMRVPAQRPPTLPGEGP